MSIRNDLSSLCPHPSSRKPACGATQYVSCHSSFLLITRHIVFHHHLCASTWGATGLQYELYMRRQGPQILFRYSQHKVFSGIHNTTELPEGNQIDKMDSDNKPPTAIGRMIREVIHEAPVQAKLERLANRVHDLNISQIDDKTILRGIVDVAQPEKKKIIQTKDSEVSTVSSLYILYRVGFEYGLICHSSIGRLVVKTGHQHAGWLCKKFIHVGNCRQILEDAQSSEDTYYQFRRTSI